MTEPGSVKNVITKHDEIRQILHETGFKFQDGRSALTMTDEEVEKFVIVFVSRMAELGRQMTKAFQQFAITITQAVEPMRNLNGVLAELERCERVFDEPI